MSKKFLIPLIILIPVIAIATIFSLYVSAFNYGNKMDNKIKAQYQQMENVLAQYSQKIQELAQVPSMYAQDFKSIVDASMQGRYGAGGSKAVFQFLTESNQNLSPELYGKISQNIEAGRKDFEFENTKLIDIKNEYNIALGSFMQGTFLRLAGFPKIKLDDYNIVSNSYAKTAIKNGFEEGPIKLR